MLLVTYLRMKPGRWENSGGKGICSQVVWWLTYRASKSTKSQVRNWEARLKDVKESNIIPSLLYLS